MEQSTYERITQAAKERLITSLEAQELVSSFTECTPENYKEILVSICAISRYWGEEFGVDRLIELAMAHFGYM
jgi:hypothetical protein